MCNPNITVTYWNIKPQFAFFKEHNENFVAWADKIQYKKT